jgi:predicted dehydrogenase
MNTRVALVGANGYGRAHRRVMAGMPDLVELVALCDLAPIRDEPEAPVPPGARLFTDYRELLATTEVDVVVIATPPHTHLEIATAAARAGADLLLEKPPVLSLTEHRELAAVLASTGRTVQVGFQDLGARSLTTLSTAVSGGASGPVDAVSAYGAWQRPDAYYQRAPWAGRRSVAGRPSLDGALANPFAHAVMECLALAEAAAGAPVWPVELEVERYRARDIEVDDTAVLRVRLDRGPPIVVAVTLCADVPREPTALVRAAGGRGVLQFRADRLRLPRQDAPRELPGRTNLLANLLAHRADPATPLLVPLARTAAFTALVEQIAAGPVPSTIDASYRTTRGAGPERVVMVDGVSEVVRQAAEQLALPSELGVPWAGQVWRKAPAPASGVQQPEG